MVGQPCNGQLYVALTDRLGRGVLGQFDPRRPVIVMAWSLVSFRTEEERRELLLHEMTHAWLWRTKQPWGHTPTFRRKLHQVLREEFAIVITKSSVRVPQGVRQIRDGQRTLPGLEFPQI